MLHIVTTFGQPFFMTFFNGHIGTKRIDPNKKENTVFLLFVDSFQ